MKRILYILLALVLIISCSKQETLINDNIEISDIKENSNFEGGTNMKIISNNFNNNGDIPSKFSCQGQDIRPHLKWSDFPKETKSFAISVIDPDAPMGDFIHWLIYNIPLQTTELDEGLNVSSGTTEVTNDFGQKKYGGPCPPSGKHRYFFVVYAIDVEKLDGLNKNNFLDRVTEHTLDSAELIGLYQKK